jgi:hypothetical protein
MSGSSKFDLATAATSSVITADQLMKAIQEHQEGQEGHPKKHLAYAAVGAAVAVGSLELLRRDDLKTRASKHPTETADADAEHFSHHQYHHHDSEIVEIGPSLEEHYDSQGHKRRLAEEIAGAYSLGQEIMGHKKHHVTHVVAEVLGAIAAMKNTEDHVDGMR